MYQVSVSIAVNSHVSGFKSLPVRGLGFDSSIPINGSYEIFLNEEKETRWVFEHNLSGLAMNSDTKREN